MNKPEYGNLKWDYVSQYRVFSQLSCIFQRPKQNDPYKPNRNLFLYKIYFHKLINNQHLQNVSKENDMIAKL